MTGFTYDPSQLPPGFQLDSGFREDMILSIHGAHFAPHAEYQEGHQLMLWLLGTDENDEAVEVRMSIGSDWTTDDGNVVTHPTKRNQIINKNSIYGFWLQYCYEIPALMRVLADRSAALGGVGARDARLWLDLILHLQARELSWGRGIDPQDRLMPIEFLGLVTDTPAGPVTLQAPQPPTTTGVPQVPPVLQAPITPNPDLTTTQPPVTVSSMPIAPTTTGPATDPAAVVAAARQQAELARQQQAAAAVTNGSPLFNRAIELAKASPDFGSFLTATLGDPEILADDELAMQCADENQIWAAAHSS